MSEQRVLDINEAAAYLHVGDELVRVLVKEGKLRRLMIGKKKYLFDAKELDRFIEAEQSELTDPKVATKVATTGMVATRKKQEQTPYKWLERHGIHR